MSKFIGFVIGAIEIGVGIATGNVALIISGAAMILSQAAADLTAPKTPARAASELTIQLGEQPRCAIYGEAYTAGSLVDAFNYGGQYGTDWEVQIVRLADHKCQALTGFYVNDQYVAYAGDGDVAGFNGQLQVFFRNDTTNQALPAIVTTYGPGWTATDTGDSGCDVVVAYKADAPNAQNPAWPGGRPRFGWVVKGKLCYDPRLDSTVPGGSGAHRWADPTTWTWSENAAVCRYNWVRGVFANDAVTDPTALLVGRGLSDAEAPPANIFAAANVCDEVVSGAPRYRVAGPIYANQQFIDVETMFAQATGGVTVTVQGSVELEPGQAKSVVASFTDDDLLTASKVTWNDEILSESATDWVNSVVANYVEPTQQWQAHDAPVVRDTADIIADGEPREATLTLRLVKWVAQAQRVAEIVRRMGRQWGRGTVTLGPSFCQLEDGDWVNWTSNRHFGGATKTFRIDAYSIDPKWQNTLQLRLINSLAFAEGAFNPDQADAVGTTAPVLVAPAVGDFALTATTLSGSGEVLPALQLAGAATWSNVEAIWLEYRVYAVGLGVDANWVSASVESPLLTSKTIPVAGSTQYQVSLRYRVSGTWSPRRILGPVLTTAYGIGWGGNVTGVPIYLTDGRVGYGLTAPGDIARPMPNSIRVSSGIMGHAAGGTYTGDLNATLGASWGTNLAGRPANLSALAGTEAINNVLVPLGQNVVVNSELTLIDPNLSTTYPAGFFEAWHGSHTPAPTVVDARVTLADASYALGRTCTGAMTAGDAVDGLTQDYTQNQRFLLPVKPGDTIALSALIAHQGMSAGYVEAQFHDEAFSYAGEISLATVSHDIGAAAFTSVSRKDMALATAIVVIPADGGAGTAGTGRVRWVRLNVRFLSDGTANPRMLVAAPFMAKIATGQTAVPTYQPGPADRLSTYGAAWGSTITGRPIELTDGRVSAGLASSGDLQRPITNSLRVSSGIMGHAAGGTYTGDLNATLGASWGTNLAGRPANLSALAGTEAINNALVPVGKNAVVNSDWTRGAFGWAINNGSTANDGRTISADLNLSGYYSNVRNVAWAAINGASAGWPATGGVYADAWWTKGVWNGGSLADQKQYGMPAKQGQRLFARCLAAQHRCGFQLYLLIFNAAGTLVEDTAWAGALDVATNGNAGTNGDPANFNIVGGYWDVTAADAASATLLMRMVPTGAANPYIFFMEPMLGVLPAGQTALPPYTAGVQDSLLVKSGSGAMLGDGFTIPPIVAAGNRYIYSQTPTYSAPTTNTSNVGSSTISLAAGTLTIGGRTVSYGAMTVNVTGSGSTTVTYYLYGDDPTFSGSTTLVATTSPTTVTSGTGRVGFGQVTITYPASGGTGTGGGGGGGGGFITCVASEAWVETMRGLVQARDVVPGDVLRVLTDDRNGTTWEVCQASRPAFDLCYRIRGNDSRFAVTVSRTTPITLRDGSNIQVVDVDGHELPFCAGDDFWWEPCTIEAVGERSIQKISVHGKTYAAGDAPGLSILTHNTAKP